MVLILSVAAIAVWQVRQVVREKPTITADQIALLNPKSLVGDESKTHFLPTPVAAIPPEPAAIADVPPASEQQPEADPGEQVRVAHTGGVGAVLRTEPPRGPRVAALRDGQMLTVLERQQVGGDEWIHAKTANGQEGWVYGPLVEPAP